jgi:ubiquitin C-terminal hydrolase
MTDMDETIIGVSRFNNIDGVTCYMNSILAVLQQTPILTDYIITEQFKDILLEKDIIKEDVNKLTTNILFQFYNLLNVSYSHNNAVINPYTFRRAISAKDDMWGRRQQQDSQEFLTFLLNSIEDELSKKMIYIPGQYAKLYKKHNVYDNIIMIKAVQMWTNYIKNEFSIIKNLFGGMTHITIKCEYCSNISHNFDITQLLQLSIPCIDDLDLYKCMDEYSREEQVDKKNKINCDLCGRKSKSLKQTLLWKTPKVLIIQLKRFKVNDYGVVYQKITDMVKYPVYNFNISKYVDKLSPYYEKKCNYNLYAVNLHHNMGKMSNSINNGHYTTYAFNRHNNYWYEFNDSKQLDKITDMNTLITDKAYMLFYYRDN